MSFPDKPIAHLLGSSGPVHAVTYSSSRGEYILTGSADRSIRLYNPSAPATAPLPTGGDDSSSITSRGADTTSGQKQPPPLLQGKLIQTYQGHGYEVLSLSVSANNDTFASSGGDRAVLLWDVAAGRIIRRFGTVAAMGAISSSSSSATTTEGGHTSRVHCVSFAGQDDSLLASGGADTTVRFWDVRAGSPRPVQVLSEARDAVTCLAVRGPEVLAGSVDGKARAYDMRTGRCTHDNLASAVTSVGFTKGGEAALVGTLDGKVRLMDRADGTCLQTLENPARSTGGLVLAALLGGKDRYVVAGDELSAAGEPLPEGEGRVWVWDLVSGKVTRRIAVPWGPPGYGMPKKVAPGRGGKGEVRRKNITSCLAGRGAGWGDQFCVGGTSGVVTVFGVK